MFTLDLPSWRNYDILRV